MELIQITDNVYIIDQPGTQKLNRDCFPHTCIYSLLNEQIHTTNQANWTAIDLGQLLQVW